MAGGACCVLASLTSALADDQSSAETAGRGAAHERLLVTPWRSLTQRTKSSDRLGSSAGFGRH